LTCSPTSTIHQQKDAKKGFQLNLKTHLLAKHCTPKQQTATTLTPKNNPKPKATVVVVLRDSAATTSKTKNIKHAFHLSTILDHKASGKVYFMQ
jgi:Uma2 family endonuclease